MFYHLQIPNIKPSITRFLFLSFFLLASFAWGQTLLQTFTTTTTYNIPAGVYYIQVEAWGAGGGGGGRSGGGGGGATSGGGGGGAYARSIIPVTPGQLFYINVGTGGASNTAGGDSWINTSNTPPVGQHVLAKGGSGGTNNSGTGGAGGSADDSYGNIVTYGGGTGGTGENNGNSGGGGSSAGTASAGTNGGAPAGGTAPSGGGNGANGVATNGAPANNGFAPGGGGGGAKRAAGNGTWNGGTGGGGQIRISSIEIADLSVSQTIRHDGYSGLTTFSVLVRNNSPTTAATDVLVTDVLNANWSFTNNPANYVLSDGEILNTTTAQNVQWGIDYIAPGGFAILIFNAPYSGDVWESSSVTCIATVTSPDDPTPSNTGNIISTVEWGPYDLIVSKTIDNPTPYIGNTVEYTVEISKAVNGPGSLGSDITYIIDKLPAGLQYVSHNASNGNGTYNPTTGVWTLGSTWDDWPEPTLTITATVLPPVVDNPNQYKNVAASTGNLADSNIANNIDILEIFPTEDLTATNLSITKSVNNPTPAVSSNVVFTINVTNNGPNDATDVVVTDVIPSGYEFVSSVGSTYNSGTKTVTRNLGNIAVDGNASFTITAKVLGTGNHTNTATVAHAGSDPVPSNNSDSASVSPTLPEADLRISSMFIDNPNGVVGSNVTFTINIENNGPNPASSVTVSALLPSGFQFVGSITSTGTTYNDITGVWNVGNLLFGQTSTIQIIAKVLPTGIYSLNAEITGGVSDPNETNNLASASIINPVDLAITKVVTSSLTPNVGDPVTFLVTVENVGATHATGVVVKDIIPTGYTYSNNNAGASYDAGTKTLTWNVGGLAPSASQQILITAIARAGGSHNNTATVSANEGDTVPGNNSASASVTPNLASAVDLKVTQSVNNETPLIDDVVTFTITAENLGPNPATGVNVHIKLANGLQLETVTPSTGTYIPGTGGVGDWLIGSMANLAKDSITIEARVLPGDGAAYLSIAEIFGNEDANDNDIINNRAYSILSPLDQTFLICDVNAENPVFEETFGSGTAIFGGELVDGRTNLTYFEPPSPPGTWSEDATNYVSDGRYVIGHNANDAFNVWKHVPDHTGNTNGYYMIMNASMDPHEFFRMRVDLAGEYCSNTQYTVSVWVANVNSEADYNYCTIDDESHELREPKLGFFVQNHLGEVLGAGTSGSVPYNPNPEWIEYTFIFTTSDDDEYIDLVFFNQELGGCGNDLAIDDITVYACMTPPIRLDMRIETEELEVCGGETVVMEVIYEPDGDYVWPPIAWSGHEVKYQWQRSEDQINWFDIPGETTDTYIIEDFQIEDQAYYRLMYAQDGNLDKESCRFPSDDLFPVFNATPDIPPIKIVGDVSYICGGGVPDGTLQLYTEYDTSAYVDEEGNPNWGPDYYFWESSNQDVATIDQNGLVTAMSLGITTITYTVWSPKGACEDSVTKEISVLEICPTCVEEPVDTVSGGVESIVGISTMAKQQEGWPENIPNGYIVLDSKSKGFVITRVPNTGYGVIPNPKEGMLVYDEMYKCIRLYNGAEWRCIEQECE